MVKYLNPANHQPVRITKTDKEFANTHDFSDIKFPVKIRDIQKIYKKKKKNSIEQGCEEKLVLLLIGEERKRHYVLIKDFNTFMYNHTLHCVLN